MGQELSLKDKLLEAAVNNVSRLAMAKAGNQAVDKALGALADAIMDTSRGASKRQERAKNSLAGALEAANESSANAQAIANKANSAMGERFNDFLSKRSPV